MIKRFLLIKQLHTLPDASPIPGCYGAIAGGMLNNQTSNRTKAVRYFLNPNF